MSRVLRKPTSASGSTLNLLVTLVVTISLCDADARAVMIPTVPVGNPGNPADTRYDPVGHPSGVGSVAYPYRIGKTEVTNAQYVDFLNGVDPTGANTLALYHSSMSGDARGGINFNAGATNGAKYEIQPGRDNNPVVFVSWYDAIRFTNWLHNGQGNADTETGAYTLGTLGGDAVPFYGPFITRNAGARWFLPSEDEWYKAAYHKNDGVTANYWDYPTSTNAVPYSDQPPGIGAPDPANTVNFYRDDGIANGYNDGYAVTGSKSFDPSQNYLTDAGTYTLSASPYGTFDQGGNVWEWNEWKPITRDDRGLRGSSWNYDSIIPLSALSWIVDNPAYGNHHYGFRVASIPEHAIPEPSTLALVALGLLSLGHFARRRTSAVPCPGQRTASFYTLNDRPSSLGRTLMMRLMVLSVFACAMLAATTAWSATYTFTSIIDSTVAAPTGNYLNIGEAAISGHKVAFKAGYNQGFLGILDGIFTSTGGPRTKVVQELNKAPLGETFSAIFRPAIDGDTVLFDARVFFGSFTYGDGVFKGTGQQGPDRPLVSTVIAPIHGETFSTYRTAVDPRISNGVFAYRGSTGGFSPDSIIVNGGGGVGVFRIGPGDPVPSGGTFSAIDANYGLSGSTVAFHGLFGSQEGIFSSTDGLLTTIAIKGDTAPSGDTLDTVLEPAISGNRVAFVGTFAGGSGIFTGTGGPLSAVARTGGATPGGHTFTAFSSPAISGDLVAFRAEHTGGAGIYTKTTAGELSSVIEIGDSLFGSTVASLNFRNLGLDAGGSGNLAFTYGLADGRSGVAMGYVGTSPPAIYQWEFANPADPTLGKRQSATPVADSAGLVAVPVVDLANRNLTMAYLVGADLMSANIANADLTNAFLRSADLTNANLSGADLSHAVLDAARLAGVNLDGADLTGASLAREFVTTVSCVFTCVTTTTGYGGIAPAQLYGTVNYQARDLTGIDFDGNNFANAILTQQNLTDVDLHAAVLTGADLAGAVIRGASFGRYSRAFGCEGKPAYNSCHAATTGFGTGLSPAQISATASYVAQDLVEVDFAGNVLTGIDLTEQNLSGALLLGANLENANFSHAILTNANLDSTVLAGANFFGADSRGSILPESAPTGAAAANLIRPDGHIHGLDLGDSQRLLIRDYDGDPQRTPEPLAPVAITVDQHLAMGPGGTLRMVFEADAWDSTISFAPGIPVTLGGTLELTFADNVNLASQLGRTFELFNWTGVAPTGAFAISSPFFWNLSKLYSSGEVIVAAIPEPSTFLLLVFVAGVLVVRTLLRRSRITVNAAMIPYVGTAPTVARAGRQRKLRRGFSFS